MLLFVRAKMEAEEPLHAALLVGAVDRGILLRAELLCLLSAVSINHVRFS